MIAPFGSPETTYLGSVFVVFGYLLAVHEWAFLVAGYDDSSGIPREVVTDMVGRFALLVGLATIGFGAILRGSGAFDRYGPVFAVIVFLATFGLIYRLNAHARRETTAGQPAAIEATEQGSIEPPTKRSTEPSD